VAGVVKESKGDRRARRIHSLWERRRDRAKVVWVIAVMAFWITAAILGVVYYLEGRLDLILVSIALGLMMLGLWLKTRYQWILRKEPERLQPPIDEADGQDHHPGA
jgi:hypothetical protein